MDPVTGLDMPASEVKYMVDDEEKERSGEWDVII